MVSQQAAELSDELVHLFLKKRSGFFPHKGRPKGVISIANYVSFCEIVPNPFQRGLQGGWGGGRETIIAANKDAEQKRQMKT